MGGYYHYEAALQVGKELPNVMVDTSAIPYPWMVRRAVEVLGAERVLYASDGPGCLPALEVEKIHLAGLSASQEEQVFSGNIRRVLEAVRHAL
jgi:predicted TIM-barrel fold metal-dependent hydrolase